MTTESNNGDPTPEDEINPPSPTRIGMSTGVLTSGIHETFEETTHRLGLQKRRDENRLKVTGIAILIAAGSIVAGSYMDEPRRKKETVTYADDAKKCLEGTTESKTDDKKNIAADVHAKCQNAMAILEKRETEISLDGRYTATELKAIVSKEDLEKALKQ